MSVTTFVVGGTGSISSQTICEILVRGGLVRALVRSQERAGRLPEGTEPFIADLADDKAIRAGL